MKHFWKSHSLLDEVRKNGWDFDAQISHVLDIKNNTKQDPKYQKIWDTLREHFNIDGAVKLNSKKLQWELKQQGISSKDIEILFDNLSHYSYQIGEEIVFRSPEYYFLLDGIEVDEIWSHKSVNDYRIDSFDLDTFTQNINIHYNSIYQTMWCIQKIIEEQAFESLKTNRKRLKNKKNKFASSEILEERLFPLTALRDGQKQYHNMKQILLQYQASIDVFVDYPSKDSYYNMLWVLFNNYTILSWLWKEMKIDFIWLIESCMSVNIWGETRKVLLGLLDSKMNILAFFQNIEKILMNENFLNPDYSWSLIFNSDQVKNISKVCPDLFDTFKQEQDTSALTRKGQYGTWRYLEIQSSCFIDILLWDWDFSSVLTTIMPSDDFNVVPKYWDELSTPVILKHTQSIVDNFFNLFSTYIEKTKGKIEKQQQKYIKKTGLDPSNEKINQLDKVYKKAINKLIRLYREENNPFAMIETTIHTYHDMLSRWYSPEIDRVYFIWVSYGWELVSYYAKSIFEKIIKNAGYNEPGNITYSVYDIKNTNNFNTIIDYPTHFAYQWDEDTDKWNKKWMIILDDNTNSGQTLSDLKKMSEESELYDEVHIAACRVGSDISKYSQDISSEDMLDLFIRSAETHRQSHINPEWQRYKASLWTIIWNKIYKQSRRWEDQ